MKICPNCSTPLSDDAKFCSSCGCTINNTQTNAYDAGAGYAEPVINDFAYSQQQYAPDPYAQPTMDSVQPVIDPAAQSVPTMDSVQPAVQYDSNGFAYNQGYGQYQQPMTIITMHSSTADTSSHSSTAGTSSRSRISISRQCSTSSRRAFRTPNT